MDPPDARNEGQKPLEGPRIAARAEDDLRLRSVRGQRRGIRIHDEPDAASLVEQAQARLRGVTQDQDGEVAHGRNATMPG